MNWWRVELDESGAILKCDQVEAGKIGSATRITYVRANTSAEACEYAKQWAERKNAADRERAKKRYEKRRAAGLCAHCGRHAGGGATCAECKAAAKHRPRATQPRKARRSPVEQLEAARIAARRDQFMRLPLTAILREFDRRTPADFRNWLVREIAERDVRAYADMHAAAE